MKRADYDEAAELAAAAGRAARLPADRFALADRQVCERVSSEHYEAAAKARRARASDGRDAERTGAAWADLAARVQRALGGTYAPFSYADVTLIETAHLALLRAMPPQLGDELGRARVKDRSRALSRLGVLVLLATRGQLEQLRGRNG